MWTLLTPRIDQPGETGYFQRTHSQSSAGRAEALNLAETALDNKHTTSFLKRLHVRGRLAAGFTTMWRQPRKMSSTVCCFTSPCLCPLPSAWSACCFPTPIFTNASSPSVGILVLLIVIIYNVHPAFQLAYSPMVVILAFFIMGLSLIVTLIIFFRFEEEMASSKPMPSWYNPVKSDAGKRLWLLFCWASAI